MAFQTINPTTGEKVIEFRETTDTEVEVALEKAYKCYTEDWKNRSIQERAKIVSRAAAILREKEDEYVDIAILEMGKLRDQAYGEVALSADVLDYYAKNAEQFLAPQALPDALGAVLVTEPIGVILGIEPWNFPYYQLARVAGPQIMAGNVVILKHAENVPQCALAFARLFVEAGAPEGVYTNVFCSHDQAGVLVDDFRVRGVTLTGSERAGSIVGARAASALKKAVLELGGSDPMLILEDAPLEDAIQLAATGRMLNMGQACASTKRVIVVGEQRGAQILDGLVRAFGNLTAGDPAEQSTSIGPIVSETALQGLLKQVQDAEDAGARVVVGGKRIDRPGFYMEPTIVADIDADNPLYRQEAFGPVLSFYVVKNEDEAVALANDTPFGLGGQIIAGDVEHAKEIAARLDAGMIYINSTSISSPDTPWGGVKNSGYGRELSELGIGEFVNRKLIRVAMNS